MRGLALGLSWVLVGAVGCDRSPSASPVGPVEVGDAAGPTTTPDVDEPAIIEPPTPDPGPPARLTAIKQREIGPTHQLHHDPAGVWIAWKLDDPGEPQCGLWRVADGVFAGGFPHTDDGPCASWPRRRPNAGPEDPLFGERTLRSVGSTLFGSYQDTGWVERPYELLAAVGDFTSATEVVAARRELNYELLVIGMAGPGAAWLRQTLVWSNRDAPDRLQVDLQLDGAGQDWAALRGLDCQLSDGGVVVDRSRDCSAFGRQPTCELLDLSPDGELSLSACTTGLVLLDPHGNPVIELGPIAPDRAPIWRWLDADTLAVHDQDGALRLITLSTETMFDRIPDVRELHALVGGGEHGLFAYRTADAFVVRSVDGNRRFDGPANLRAAALDPTGTRVAVSDLERIHVHELATGAVITSWKASKIRQLAYRQDGAVVFGTQLRERGPRFAWDVSTGEPRDDALPPAAIARRLADNPSWRWYWRGDGLYRALDGRFLHVDYQGVMLDNGLYEGEVPRALSRVVLRRGDAIDDFVLIDAVDLAPALRRAGLVQPFLAGAPLPEVEIGEHELARLLALAGH